MPACTVAAKFHAGCRVRAAFRPRAACATTTRITSATSLPATPDAGAHPRLAVRAGRRRGRARTGEVASRRRSRTLLAGFREAPRRRSRIPACCRAWCRPPTRRCTKPARQPAPGGVAMATTLVACALRYDRAVVAHVGDSRCYLIRRGHATPLTRDHTVANEQVRLGMLSASEAAEAPQPPRAQPLAGQRPVRQRRHQRAPGAARRRAAALLRRAARRR